MIAVQGAPRHLDRAGEHDELGGEPRDEARRQEVLARLPLAAEHDDVRRGRDEVSGHCRELTRKSVLGTGAASLVEGGSRVAVFRFQIF